MCIRDSGSICDPRLDDLGINCIKQLGGRKDTKAHWEIAILLLLQSQSNSANLHWGKWRVTNGVFGWNPVSYTHLDVYKRQR